MRLKLFAMIVSVCTFACGAFAQNEQAAPQKLLGIAAWSQLVGNSITGQEDGKTLVEYYAPDGTAKSMLGNEISAAYLT